MAQKKTPATLAQVYPWILAVGGAIGTWASIVLTYDKIRLAENPGFHLDCNLNPIVACGSVIKTTQASALGFPNSFMGIAGFAVVTTIGVALLAGGRFEQLKRWFWLGLQLGATLGALFVHWLFFETVYRIHALCPYCMTVWAVTMPIFWYTTLYNLRTGVIPTPPRLKGVVGFMQRHHGDILLVWFLIIAGLILNHFWYYWKTVI